MAAKFKIFCDDHSSQSNAAAPSKESQFPNKREPLGLRQAMSQLAAESQVASQQETLPSIATTTSSSSCAGPSSVNEEDQENDISMASLGSDFIPSILHDDAQFQDNSFEEEEEDNDERNCSDEQSGYSLYGNEGENSIIIAEDELVDEDDDDDFEDDEELKKELSQAFRQHDDSQLFKSTVYLSDIESYLNELERETELRALPNYMDYQTDIDSDKRAILINWLVDVSDEYELETETLFICINIIDRFLSKMSVPTSNFQLLGVAAMFIATKYEEIYPPELSKFVEVTDEAFSGQQIRQMEQEILKALNFRISLPTITFFLRRIFAFNKFTKKVYHLAEYLCYLSLLADQPFLEYYPSEIALAAVILAAHQLDAAASISPDLQGAYDRSNQDQLKRRNLPRGAKQFRELDRRAYIVDMNLPFCIESLRELQERTYSRASKLKDNDCAVFVKFSSEAHSRVALLSPPKVEDLLAY